MSSDRQTAGLFNAKRFLKLGTSSLSVYFMPSDVMEILKIPIFRSKTMRQERANLVLPQTFAITAVLEMGHGLTVQSQLRLFLAVIQHVAWRRHL